MTGKKGKQLSMKGRGKEKSKIIGSEKNEKENWLKFQVTKECHDWFSFPQTAGRSGFIFSVATPTFKGTVLPLFLFPGLRILY